MDEVLAWERSGEKIAPNKEDTEGVMRVAIQLPFSSPAISAVWGI